MGLNHVLNISVGGDSPLERYATEPERIVPGWVSDYMCAFGPAMIAFLLLSMAL